MTARSNRVRHMPQRRDAIHIVDEQPSPIRWSTLAKRFVCAAFVALFWGAVWFAFCAAYWRAV